MKCHILCAIGAIRNRTFHSPQNITFVHHEHFHLSFVHNLQATVIHSTVSKITKDYEHILNTFNGDEQNAIEYVQDEQQSLAITPHDLHHLASGQGQTEVVESIIEGGTDLNHIGLLNVEATCSKDEQRIPLFNPKIPENMPSLAMPENMILSTKFPEIVTWSQSSTGIFIRTFIHSLFIIHSF